MPLEPSVEMDVATVIPVVENYTITLTFRRAADLEPGMPTTPSKKGTVPTQSSTSVKPTANLD